MGDTADDWLARRYRRLLRAYPRDYRRGRGEEILDTLLSAAPPRRRRPTTREAVNLLRYGLRCHLGRPGSRRIVVGAALAAIITGFLGASAVGRLSWEATRSLPDATGAADIGQLVLPGVLPVTQERHDETFYYDDPPTAWTPFVGNEDYGRGWVGFAYNSDQDADTLATRARGELQEAGWRVGDVVRDHGRRELDADRDGLTIELRDGGNRSTWSPRLELTITRTEPWWMWPAAVLGGLGSALAGWLLAGWVSRRLEGRGAALQAITWCLAAGAILGMLPAFGLSLVAWAGSFVQPTPGASAPIWFGLTTYGRLPAILAAVAAMVAVGIAALARRAAPTTRPSPPLPLPG
jgi:hypothetical protein